MVAVGQLRVVRLSVREVWRHGRPIERAGYAIGVVLTLWGMALSGVFLASDRPWGDPLSWGTPGVFGLMFGLTLAAVVWVSTWVRLHDRVRMAVLGALIAASALAVGVVSLRAARDGSTLDSVVSTALALILISILALTIAALRPGSILRPDMRLAIGFGLAALGVSVAVMVHGTVTARTSDAQLAYAGVFEPIHAVATHAVLVLPAMAWLLGFTGWTKLLRSRVIQLAVAGYTLLGVVVGIESFTDTSPFAAPWYADVAALVGLAAATLAGGATLFGMARFPARRG
ncbi:MAG: hypothetical protein M3548_01515 [Actinomycetota bacterium]|nr:hypothetical protein [Actinomycetota bacterium]